MKRSYIYVIQAGALPFFKIGWSSNIKSRIDALQTGCPLRIEIRHRKRDASLQDEKALHRKLKPWCTCGEWYSATTESIAVLQEGLGIRLKFKIGTIDEAIVTQRVDAHRQDLLAATDGACAIVQDAVGGFNRMVERSERLLLLLADHETLQAVYEATKKHRGEIPKRNIPNMWDRFKLDEQERRRTRNGRARPLRKKDQ